MSAIDKARGKIAVLKAAENELFHLRETNRTLTETLKKIGEIVGKPQILDDMTIEQLITHACILEEKLHSVRELLADATTSPSVTSPSVTSSISQSTKPQFEIPSSDISPYRDVSDTAKRTLNDVLFDYIDTLFKNHDAIKRLLEIEGVYLVGHLPFCVLTQQMNKGYGRGGLDFIFLGSWGKLEILMKAKGISYSDLGENTQIPSNSLIDCGDIGRVPEARTYVNRRTDDAPSSHTRIHAFKGRSASTMDLDSIIFRTFDFLKIAYDGETFSILDLDATRNKIHYSFPSDKMCVSDHSSYLSYCEQYNIKFVKATGNRKLTLMTIPGCAGFDSFTQ